MDNKLCINCVRFSESKDGKYYCFLSGRYEETIHNPKMESCNMFLQKVSDPSKNKGGEDK